MTAPVLDVRAVAKQFGGLKAVDGVSFSVGHGEILGLVGPNGSGKSTVLNVLSGIYDADQGEVRLNGEKINGMPPHTIAAAGLGRTFQNLQIFQGLSLAENVLTGANHRQRAGLVATIFGLPGARGEEAEARDEARQLLTRVGLSGRDDDSPTALSYGQRRLLEIARALATRPQVLMLDEPCAGLSQGESDILAGLIRELAAQGLSVIVIEHNMRFVMGLAARMAVLNFGRKIAEGTPAEVRDDPQVIEAYLGKVRHARR